MTPLLSVHQLSTSFATDAGIARAVDDVSFDLEQGETLGLVGESGCGKTVTALSILRLIAEPPGQYGKQSRIEYEGVNLLDLSPNELREIRGAQIAMIFQEPMSSLNPVLTIGSQIVEAIRAHEPVSKNEATDRAVELLTVVSIPDPDRRMKDYPHQMSGGMQQRVMIAMALSCRPKILIADEPTTALDVTIQAQILDLLKDLKARFGMSVIFITHDLGVLAGIADRVAVMYGGKIVEHGRNPARSSNGRRIRTRRACSPRSHTSTVRTPDCRVFQAPFPSRANGRPDAAFTPAVRNASIVAVRSPLRP